MVLLALSRGVGFRRTAGKITKWFGGTWPGSLMRRVAGDDLHPAGGEIGAGSHFAGVPLVPGHPIPKAEICRQSDTSPHRVAAASYGPDMDRWRIMIWAGVVLIAVAFLLGIAQVDGTQGITPALFYAGGGLLVVATGARMVAAFRQGQREGHDGSADNR